MKSVMRGLLVLALVGSSVPVQLKAEAAGESSPGEDRWTLVSYSDKSGNMRPLEPGIKVDAIFSSGRISGSAGCNRYSGTYTKDDAGSLNISDGIAATRMACAPPAEQMEQTYLSLFKNISGYRIENETLVLIDDQQQEVLRFNSARTAGLASTVWQAAGINNGRGGVVSDRNTHRATATFAQGRISGMAGCNGFSATFSVNGDRLSIGPIMTTRKHCGEPAGIMQQEQQYLDALAKTRTFVAGADQLELRDDKGSLMVRFIPGATQH